MVSFDVFGRGQIENGAFVQMNQAARHSVSVRAALSMCTKAPFTGMFFPTVSAVGRGTGFLFSFVRSFTAVAGVAVFLAYTG